MFQEHSRRLGYLSGQLGLARVPSALLILCAQPAGGGGGQGREKYFTRRHQGHSKKSPSPPSTGHRVVRKRGSRSQPESSVAGLRDMLIYLALPPPWWWPRSQVLFLTTIPIMVFTGNRVEFVSKSTGPGIRCTLVQVLVLPPSSCGPSDTYLNLSALICRRGAPPIGRLSGANAVMRKGSARPPQVSASGPCPCTPVTLPERSHAEAAGLPGYSAVGTEGP